MVPNRLLAFDVPGGNMYDVNEGCPMVVAMIPISMPTMAPPRERLRRRRIKVWRETAF
jgi:hypothetical protein